MTESQPEKTPQSSTSTDPVKQYALDVVEGRETAGRYVRLACERHLRDLKDGEARGLWWDLPAALRVINYFKDVLRLPSGEPFLLRPAQAFIVGSLFGWKGADGFRRFQVAYEEAGKGSGKSPKSAGIGLYMMTSDGEQAAEVYAGAVDRDQAKILFGDAVLMVQQSPALSSKVTVSGGRDGDHKKAHNLAFVSSASFFRPLSSENISGRGKSGFRPHCLLFDEVHEHPSGSMIETMRKNLGKNRNQPLMILSTNSGVYDINSICWTYHSYAVKVLQGQLQDDAFFAYVCTLDPCASCLASGNLNPNPECPKCDHWRDERVWKKTNPLLDFGVPSRKYLRQQILEAEGMPSNESKTRRWNFCEWTEAANPAISAEVWARNSNSVPLEALKGRTCYGGLDLSGKNDLTALVLVFPLDDGKKAVIPYFWTPEEGLRKREERDKAPYTRWAREGLLNTVPGKTIAYSFVAKQIGEILKTFHVETIAFDRWRIDDMIRELDAEGVDVKMQPHAQSFQDMNPSIETWVDDCLEGRLMHGNHPVLTLCVSNAQFEEDKHGNRAFTKRNITGRIDGAVALAMADGLTAQKAETEPQFFVFGGGR